MFELIGKVRKYPVTHNTGDCSKIGIGCLLGGITLKVALLGLKENVKAKFWHNFLWLAACCFLLAGMMIIGLVFFPSKVIKIGKWGIYLQDGFGVLCLGVLFMLLSFISFPIKKIGLTLKDIWIEFEERTEIKLGARSFCITAMQIICEIFSFLTYKFVNWGKDGSKYIIKKFRDNLKNLRDRKNDRTPLS